MAAEESCQSEGQNLRSEPRLVILEILSVKMAYNQIQCITEEPKYCGSESVKSEPRLIIREIASV